MEYVIRPTRQEDYPQLVKIFQYNYTHKPYDEKWDYDSSLKNIEIHVKGSELSLVYEEKNKILGFVMVSKYFWFDGFRWNINEINIEHNSQNRGIGRLLLEEVEKQARFKNIKIITLTSSEKSEQAVNFYTKNGYKKTEWVQRYKEIK